MSSKRLKTDGGAGGDGLGAAFEGDDAAKARARAAAGYVLPDTAAAAGQKSTAPAHEEKMASLRAADGDFARRIAQIDAQIDGEQRRLIASLQKKRRTLHKEAKMKHHQEKSEILNRNPSATCACSLCEAPMKIPAARCINDDCGGIFCKSCLRSKVEEQVRCHRCTDVTNVMCPSCLEARNKKGWYQFDYCREDCGFLCPDHTRFEDCCVCAECPLCSGPEGNKCYLPECGRCGEKLCTRCDIKEGCMCVD
ncbi:hypothetical protein ACHAXT_013324 [Thalassiosira profunda]